MTHAIQNESVVSKIVITTSKGITDMEVSKLIVSQINMASPKLPVMVLGIGLDANMIGLENFASEPTDLIQTIGKNQESCLKKLGRVHIECWLYLRFFSNLVRPKSSDQC